MVILVLLLFIGAGLGLLSLITAIVSKIHDISRRAIKGKMRKTNNIKPNAEIISVTPEFHKLDGPGYVSCDVIIEFSDGSYYCESIGTTRRKKSILYPRGINEHSYTEADIRGAIYDAVKAHEDAVRKKC